MFILYRNSGNFRVKRLSPIKFLCQKIFVPATPYHSNMHTFYTAMKNFVHNRAYENFLTTKISRTTVYTYIPVTATHHCSVYAHHMQSEVKRQEREHSPVSIVLSILSSIPSKLAITVTVRKLHLVQLQGIIVCGREWVKVVGRKRGGLARYTRYHYTM